MKQIRVRAIVIACMVGCVAVPQAMAEVSNHARNLSGSCAACHGTDGHSVNGTPVLAGMDRKLFIAQMKAFKSGERSATVMHQHAKGYSDEEFELMADYFAAQKR